MVAIYCIAQFFEAIKFKRFYGYISVRTFTGVLACTVTAAGFATWIGILLSVEVVWNEYTSNDTSECQM